MGEDRIMNKEDFLEEFVLDECRDKAREELNLLVEQLLNYKLEED